MNQTSNHGKTRVDFVIPTLNEEMKLPLLLTSIAEQELGEGIEISKIIVVDNGSRDNTVEVAKRYGALVFSKPDYSIADLRNFGANMAIGDIIIFSDADNVLNKDTVSNTAQLLGRGQFAALGPDGLVPYGKATWMQKAWYYHTAVLGEQKQTIDVDNLSSGFFAIKSTVFSDIGGFNGSLSIGEDSDISQRLRCKGYRLVKSNVVIVQNTGHPRSVMQFIKREIWHGDSIRHLVIHKNVDLLTLYFILNLVMWLGLFAGIFYMKSLPFILANLAMIAAVPVFKALTKSKGFNKYVAQLSFVYILYALSRSIALFKFQ